MQAAAPQGDYVTPTLIGAGEADVARDQRGARRLFGMLVGDPAHGAENRVILQNWVDAWTPVSIKAARDLQPIWSQVAEKVVTFEQSLDRARTRFTGLLGELGLNTKEL
jgi:propane monooxygenase small subunit